jgi:FtsP/CotA-like multicopper oxidase with cupredoxin domain
MAIGLIFYSFLQTGTPEQDGVPGVTQCPIASGSSFTYRFRATLYGTSWWHSHYSAQYSGGAFGPMVIYGPSHVDYDIDVGSILLSDHYHRDYFSVVEQVMGVVPIVGGQPNFGAIIPLSDNNLINGMNNFDCANTTHVCKSDAPLAEFKFEKGKMHRLRLVNSGSEGVQKFSIDGHELLVIANDFTEVIPYTTKIVTLAVRYTAFITNFSDHLLTINQIGQRTDVIVQGLANGKGSYWMRSTMSACAATNQPFAKAIVHYDNHGFKPNTTAWEDNTDPCANDNLAITQPWFPIAPTDKPETTVTIILSATINSTGHFVWTMDGSAFRANYNNPVLLLSNAGNNSYPDDPEWNVYNFGSNSSVRFHIINRSPAPHPMHLHGHTMFILNVGLGQWDGTIINTHNPQLVSGPPGSKIEGFMVAQVDMDNPGVWPFHCRKF